MYREKKIGVISPAAGKGRRMGGTTPKQYMDVDGEPMIVKTFKCFADLNIIDEILIVTEETQIENCRNILASNLSEGQLNKLAGLVPGGAERQESIYKALDFLQKRPHPDYLLIHDAARPFVTKEIIENTVAETVNHGGAVVCVKPKDTIRTADETLDRDKLMIVQTPQGFEFNLICKAHEKAHQENFLGTDDAGLYERLGKKLAFVEGSYENIKITTPEDLPMDMDIRVGNGYDVHKLVEGRKCIIGGVDIPYKMGLLGHSDADVLAHAITDAILGAANLGDIGKLFPDTDAAYEGADSMVLLSKVGDLIVEKGYKVGNIDATVICERPKIGPHREQMAENIAAALNIASDRVSVKATTTEKLGFTGRKEGIAAMATVLITKN